MTDQRELDRLLGAYFVDGTDELADRVIDAALDQIDHTDQRRAMRLPRRFPTMTMPIRIAAAAVIGVLAVGGAYYLSRPAQPSVGPPGPDTKRERGSAPGPGPARPPSTGMSAASRSPWRTGASSSPAEAQAPSPARRSTTPRPAPGSPRAPCTTTAGTRSLSGSPTAGSSSREAQTAGVRISLRPSCSILPPGSGHARDR